MTSRQNKILAQAIDKWGEFFQIEMLLEELLELAVKIQKRKRPDKVTDDEIIDEIADVKIMVAQMEKIFGTDKVGVRVEFKINRLNNLINEGR